MARDAIREAANKLDHTLKAVSEGSFKPDREKDCDTPAQGLIGLIGYSYQQVTTSFPEAGLQRTPRLSVLGPEKFGDR